MNNTYIFSKGYLNTKANTYGSNNYGNIFQLKKTNHNLNTTINLINLTSNTQGNLGAGSGNNLNLTNSRNSNNKDSNSVSPNKSRIEANVRISSFSALETLYCHLGHEVYTKIMSLFEKYCFFGRTFTNFNMDYTQFNNLFTQNNIYDEVLTKSQSDVIFNKVRNLNKCK